MEAPDRPPEAALAAFGAAGRDLRPLPGGRRTAWRAGDVVLKALDQSEAALAWQEQVLGSVACDGFRVAAPLRSRDGRLVEEGWTGWPALDGVHRPRWTEIVAAGERLHRALDGVPRPSALLDARTDRWARADRVAWGEAEPAKALGPEPAALLALRRPVSAPDQLVHADLTGNVLFADGLPPAIIDLSPAWRPAPWASAVVAVDAVVWHGAGLELLGTVAGAAGPEGPQLLLRALLFRLLAEDDPASSAAAWAPAVARTAALAQFPSSSSTPPAA